ncbi:SPOR domain-containing protein [Caldimonas sp. KR1-144]|uniref:SPOR domain-containing protein n=1 Tax=Caldimonas sp. KR1-144 TaxID=3400911 RepID=UPI003C0DA408
MGLLDFFKRQASEPSQPSAGDEVQRARTRARQRLIGAAVLVAIGVIGLPMIFDTAPRPVAVGIPIEIPAKDGAAPLTPPPAAKPAASQRAELPPETRDEPAVKPAAVAAKNEGKSEPKTEPKAEPKAAESKATEPKPQPPKADSQRAAALLEGRDAPSAKTEPAKAASSAEGRFVVQVGAFAETESAREARLKVEKLGLKTYTQVVETKEGKRIRVRVGPYDGRADAEKAAGQIRSAGMTASVLTL